MWSWSHTDEAYAYARERLNALPRDELIEIAATWVIEMLKKSKPVALTDLDLVLDSELAAYIWSYASSFECGRNCSDGGHELWLDPDGCHIVNLRDMPEDWSPAE